MSTSPKKETDSASFYRLNTNRLGAVGTGVPLSSLAQTPVSYQHANADTTPSTLNKRCGGDEAS